MKNIFGLNNDNENFDGYHFRIREINPQLKEKIDEHQKENEALSKKSSLPKSLSIIKIVCFFVAITVISGIIRSLDEVTLKEAYNNIPFLFYIGGLTILIYVFILIYENNKKTNIETSEEFKKLQEDSDELIQKALEDLKVPLDAKKIDIFIYPYKIKTSKEKQVKSLQMFKYINYEFNVFNEADKLCFADSNQVIAIPLSSINKIFEINKKVSFFGWNKIEKYNKGEYKKYKITANNYGTLFIKTYYSIIINEEYELLIPGYEINQILELTNLEIEKEEGQ